MNHLRQGFEIKYKGSVDLVTQADLDSEEFLFNNLNKSFSDDSIIAEEGREKEGTSGYTWVIDPLDGTTSYSHGFPFFAVSVGLVDADDVPVLGVVYNPFYNEFFSACRGGGAFLNDKKISVSENSSLSTSLLGTGFPYNRREIMPHILDRLSRMLHNCHDVRRTGSAALDICFVAAGRTDGYFEQGLKPWDVAAATVILTEAGGRASLFNGEPVDIRKPEYIGSNRLIHEELLKMI